jgi:hypothetical protein
MYISLKDSCAKGFNKWADTYQPAIKNNLSGSGGDGSAPAAPDQDNLVMTSLERPHRPWLVPDAGNAIEQVPLAPLVRSRVAVARKSDGIELPLAKLVPELKGPS